MNVLIMYFSPAGGTAKVAAMLEKRLAAQGNQVQSLNLTANPEVFRDNRLKEYLERTVMPHDVLCFGSPVYEKHVEMYVQEVLRKLPRADGKTWGALAVPFFTFGGISSGLALPESHRLLRKGGRKVIAAMKLEASHIVCAKLKTRVNQNLPGAEAVPYIDELADAIERNHREGRAVQARELRCQDVKETLVSRLMQEKMLHEKVYGSLTVRAEACQSCLTCVARCPIQRIAVADGKPDMAVSGKTCIHCFSCVNGCPHDAVTFTNGEEGWAKIERVYGKVAKEGSFFRSRETPKSVVFPVRRD